MGTESNAAVVALQKAYKLERDGQEFYTQAAERTVDPKGAEMFRSLADDEVLHAQIIQRQMDSLAEGQGWASAADLDVGDVDLDAPLFPEGKVALDKAIRPDASDLDALLFALKIENDSFSLYVEQAKSATDANAKRMYEYLVGAERTHFDLLMTNYEAISSMGGWAD